MVTNIMIMPNARNRFEKNGYSFQRSISNENVVYFQNAEGKVLFELIRKDEFELFWILLEKEYHSALYSITVDSNEKGEPILVFADVTKDGRLEDVKIQLDYDGNIIR